MGFPNPLPQFTQFETPNRTKQKPENPKKKKRKEDRGGTINDGWMGADRASLADQLLVSWQKVVRPKGRVQAQQKRRVLGKTQLFLLFVELT